MISQSSSYSFVLLRILAQPDAKSSVTSLELTVDSETGVVNRLSQFDEKDVVREYHQLHFSRQTGDIYFPKTILQANYKNGVLAALTAIAIRSAEFNLIIDPDAFLVPIPDGTNVFDYRNSSAGVTYANVKGSADIRQSLESLAVSWPVQSGVDQFDSSRLVYWAILNLTGFALILGSVVYRRALRKK